MKKRLPALLLCLTLLLSLFGCAVASAKSVNLMEGVTAPLTRPSGILSAEASSAVAQFGLELFLPALEEENPLISPLSVLFALVMTANGAKGETLAQMEGAFGMELKQLNPSLSGYLENLPIGNHGALHIANAIWFKDTPSFTVNRDFLQTTANYYDAGLYKAPFDKNTCSDINGWVEQHTGGMVKDILDQIPEAAVMYLVNALSFEGEWTKIYNERQVREGTFTSAAGEQRTVDMMHSEEWRYLETETASGFIKPYKDGRFAFAALLPGEGLSPADCAAALTGETLTALLTSPSQEKVRVTMPKFQSEYSAELSDALRAMGMEKAFAGGDFTGIGSSSEGPLIISRVLHKTFIAVDEKGTRAGAATAVEMAPTSAPPGADPKVVVLDRPFLYFIFDTVTGLPIFMGAVTDIQ